MKAFAVVLGCVAVSVAALGGETKYEASWESLAKHPCPEWYKDAKFGIFIHWGPYAVPAFAPTDRDKYAEHFQRSLEAGKPGFREHLESHFPGKSYYDLAAQFTAHDFDAAAWAKVLRRSGAKYVVLTAKHHDGFCLWPCSTQPYWNSTCLGPHRDIVKELSDAVKASGLHMGLYFSLLERHPLYTPETIDRFVSEINHAQLKELVLKYEPEIVWPDGEWDYPAETHRGPEFLAWLLNESPVRDRVCFNDRWGKQRRGTLGDFYTTEYGHNGNAIEADFYTHPWEECRGIGGSFGYNAYEGPNEYMTADACIHSLVRIVALGGNLLLNIGPDAEGRIPCVMLERLYAIGDWLEVNGEAIYGTRYNPARYADQGKDGVYVTEKKDAVYAICTKWPRGRLVIPGVAAATGGPRSVAGVDLVGSDLKIDYTVGTDGSVTIDVPKLYPDEFPCASAWTFRIRHQNRPTLGNAAAVFTHTGKGTVAFIGGSITQGNYYRGVVKEYLQRRFPATRFSWIEAGISSTCSNTGAFRFEEDVLEKGTPDLLFAEWAVNDDQDGMFDYAECQRGMEGVIRHARRANPKTDIVMMLMVNKKEFDLLGKGEVPIPYAAHAQVAARYGVPVISIGELLVDAARRGETSWEVYKDCHPSPEGCALIAKWLTSFLDDGKWDPVPESASYKPLPEPVEPGCYDRGSFAPLTSVEMNDQWFSGWNLSVPYWPEVPGAFRDTFADKPFLWSTKPGDRFCLFFSGTDLGLFVLAGPDAGVLNVEIDGKDLGDFDLKHAHSEKLNYPYTKMIARGLEDKHHRVVFTLKSGAARIYKVGINGKPLLYYNQVVADPAQPAAAGAK